MKPSEFIKNKGTYHIEVSKDKFIEVSKDKFIGVCIWGENSSKDKIIFEFWTHEENELDKRFIDRKELKDKINEIDIWNKNGLKVKKEILELLK